MLYVLSSPKQEATQVSKWSFLLSCGLFVSSDPFHLLIVNTMFSSTKVAGKPGQPHPITPGNVNEDEVDRILDTMDGRIMRPKSHL